MADQRDLLLIFIEPLSRLALEYMITGSMASMAYGEPRLTLDVDLVVAIRREHVARYQSFQGDT